MRCETRNSAIACAFAACARTRNGSVERLRSTSQQSNGDGTPPPQAWNSCNRGKQRARLAKHQHAAQHVAVAAQVLRAAVHDDVGAKREGPLQHRRRERVVAAQERAARMREPGERRDVAYAKERIRRRFQPEQARGARRARPAPRPGRSCRRVRRTRPTAAAARGVAAASRGSSRPSRRSAHRASRARKRRASLHSLRRRPRQPRRLRARRPRSRARRDSDCRHACSCSRADNCRPRLARR